MLDNIIDMIYGNSKPDKMRYNLPLWFLPCFFSTSVIVYIQEKLSNTISSYIRYIFIAVCIGLGCFFAFNEQIALPWHIETAFSMSVWCTLGFISKRIILNNNWKKKVTIVVGTICLISGGVLSFTNVRVVGVRNEHHGIIPIYYLSALLSIIGIIVISIYIDRCLIIEKFGRYSLMILVLHKFPILLFQKVIPFTSVALSNPNTIKGIVFGVFVTIISVLLSYFVGKIIILVIPWSLGVENKELNKA